MVTIKRKVVQHGPSTLTLSLPNEWVQRHGINKGDDLLITPGHGTLQVSISTMPKHEQKALDVTGKLPFIEKAICAHYKAGVDDLLIHYGSGEELEQIHQSLTYGVVGWEVVEEGNTSVRVRSISTTDQREFKVVLRRLFLSLLSVVEDGVEAARMKDYDTAKKLILRDRTINKLADVCRRIINQQGQIEYQVPTALYHIVEQLEKIGDTFKELNELLAERQLAVSRETIGQYEGVRALLRRFYDLFFAFNFNGLSAFRDEWQQLEQSFSRAAAEGEEQRFVWLLELAGRECADLNGALMVLNF